MSFTRVTITTALSFVPSTFAGTWIYHPINGKGLGVRSEPAFNAGRTGSILNPGQQFEVAEEYVDASGARFLSLADGGWAFEYDSKGHHFCSPVAEADSSNETYPESILDEVVPDQVVGDEQSGGDNVTHLELMEDVAAEDQQSGGINVSEQGLTTDEVVADQLSSGNNETFLDLIEGAGVEDQQSGGINASEPELTMDEVVADQPNSSENVLYAGTNEDHASADQPMVEDESATDQLDEAVADQPSTGENWKCSDETVAEEPWSAAEPVCKELEVIHCGNPGNVPKTTYQKVNFHLINGKPQLAVIPNLLSKSELSAALAMVEGDSVVDGKHVDLFDGMTRRLAALVERPPHSAMISVTRLDAVDSGDDANSYPEYVASPQVNFYVFGEDVPADDGAELEFPHLGLKVRPSAGCAVYWATVQGGEEQPLLAHREHRPSRDSTSAVLVNFAL